MTTLSTAAAEPPPVPRLPGARARGFGVTALSAYAGRRAPRPIGEREPRGVILLWTGVRYERWDGDVPPHVAGARPA